MGNRVATALERGLTQAFRTRSCPRGALPILLLVATACAQPGDARDDVAGASEALVCRPQSLSAWRTYPKGSQDAIVTPMPGMRFAIPTALPVTQGNAGNRLATLYFSLGDELYKKCFYRGGASVEHPTLPDDVTAGLRYVLESCTNGAAAGEVMEADWIRLDIDAGDPKAGQTRVDVTLDEVAPCQGLEDCNVPIDDGNPCTIDECNAIDGVTHTPDVGRMCGADDLCSGSPTCDENGACVATPPVIDDGDACTIDFCDPQMGVRHTACQPLDTTVATTVAPALAFLLEGDEPVQVGVAPDAIDTVRAAGLLGTVRDDDGAPASLASVTVLGHPELGETRTDHAGRFVMLVNGGNPLTVHVEKEGRLPVQRTITPAWQTYAETEAIVLTAPDATRTAIDLTTLIDPAIARSSVVTDARGSRRATVAVTPGTAATMVFPDGSLSGLGSITVRATETSFGNDGPARTSATLPPTTGYTYAFELGLDEALAAGAARVDFDETLSFFVEDTRDLPVGLLLPLGSHDRRTGRWTAADDGVVLRVLSVASGVAEIDVTGDGVADAAPALEAAGVTAEDRVTIASLYAADQKLWHARLGHTGAWGIHLPSTGAATTAPPRTFDAAPEAPIPGEPLASAPIPGTDVSLVATATRTLARSTEREVTVQLTGASVPSALLRVEATLQIAGKTERHVLTCPCAPEQTWTVTWDGTDAFERTLQGTQNAVLTTRNVYARAYVYPDASTSPVFGSLGGSALLVNGDPVTSEATYAVDTVSSLRLGGWNAAGLGFGGLTPSVLHAYDPIARTLVRGDGQDVGPDAFAPVVTAAHLSATAIDVVALGDGSFVVAGAEQRASAQRPMIRRVFPDGSNVGLYGTAVGPGHPCAPVTAVDVPAVDVCRNLSTNADIAVGPDGSVYIPDQSRVFRITPAGLFTLFAGTGTAGSSGDGGLATAANIDTVLGVAVGPLGEVYLGEARRIRVVRPDGVIQTVAGNGTLGATGDGGPARLATVANVTDLELGADGALYFLQRRSPQADVILRKITPDGRIARAGGGVAGQLWGTTVRTFALGADGQVILEDVRPRPPGHPLPQSNLSTVREVLADETTRTLAGLGFGCVFPACTAQTPAIDVAFNAARGLAFGADGTLLVASQVGGVISFAPRLPGLGRSDFVVASHDEVLRFDRRGKLVDTRDPARGALVAAPGYDATGFLATLVDAAGRVTRFERGQSANPTAIVGPYGQRTLLSLDGEGRLARIEDPSGEAWQLAYDPAGLLATWTQRDGAVTAFGYDPAGRVASRTDGEGGTTTFVRSADGTRVTETSPLGRITLHDRSTLATTGEAVQRTTAPDGLVTVETHTRADGRLVDQPDGTDVTIERAPDPRWGMQAPVTTRETTRLPSGLTRVVTHERSAVLADAQNPLSHTSLTEITRVDGRATTTVYDASTRTETTTTPAGRATRRVFDAAGRVIQTTLGADLPIDLVYDADGRLVSTTQGARTTSRTYDGAGFLASLTNPLTQTTSWSNDVLGRRLTETRPDLAVIALDHDAEGRRTAIAPPSKPVHTFGFDGNGHLVAYTPPSLLSGPTPTTIAYDLDQQIDLVTAPGPRTIDFAYDAAGRLASVSYPGGAVTRAYDVTGALASLAGPGNVSLAFTHDGALVTGRTYVGDAVGAVTQTFDAAFRVATESVNGSAAAFVRDDDGHLLGAGALTMKRDAASGRLATSSVGVVADARSHSTHGELATYQLDVAGSAVFGFTLARDGLGRVVARTETIDGVARDEAFVLDLAGRLVEATENGALVEAYTYDANGNRLTVDVGAGVVLATVDDQDRLLTQGSLALAWNDAGDLVGMTDATTGDTWTFDHDALGQLRSIVLPDGTVIDDTFDGEGNRVARRRNGVLGRAWLYASDHRLVAELDASGNVIRRFVYGDDARVPELMIAGADTYRLVKDERGSVRLVVDVTTGAVVQRVDYDAFGRVLVDTQPGFTPFGFAGGVVDADTGFVRLEGRDYDPQIGRFVRKNPVRFGQGDGTNLYAYLPLAR